MSNQAKRNHRHNLPSHSSKLLRLRPQVQQLQVLLRRELLCRLSKVVHLQYQYPLRRDMYLQHNRQQPLRRASPVQALQPVIQVALVYSVLECSRVPLVQFVSLPLPDTRRTGRRILS